MSRLVELTLVFMFGLRLGVDLWMYRDLVADSRSFRRRIADLESAVYHLSPQEPAPHARHPLPTCSDN